MATTCKTSVKNGSSENTTDESEPGEDTTKGKKAEVSRSTAHGDKIGKKEKAVQTSESSISYKVETKTDDATQIKSGLLSIFKDKEALRKTDEKGGKKAPPSTAHSSKPGKDENAEKTKEPSKSDKIQETKDDTSNTKPGLLSIFNSIGIFLVLAIACIFAAVFVSTPEPEIKSDFNLVTIFGNGVDEFQQSFTNQTERFWRILRNRGLAHLRNKHPSQPLVFLLAAPPPAHEWVDCLATKLAKKLDPKHKRDLAMIDGNKEKNNPADKTKKKMDEFLKEKFRAGHRVALVYHLELLPPPSPLLFYSYCDHRNAPHKHAAIIFTVHLPKEPSLSLSPREAEGTVAKYLANEVWSMVERDAVAGLLSRIAEDMVVLMNGESNSSLKAFCS